MEERQKKTRRARKRKRKQESAMKNLNMLEHKLSEELSGNLSFLWDELWSFMLTSIKNTQFNIKQVINESKFSLSFDLLLTLSQLLPFSGCHLCAQMLIR